MPNRFRRRMGRPATSRAQLGIAVGLACAVGVLFVTVPAYLSRRETSGGGRLATGVLPTTTTTTIGATTTTVTTPPTTAAAVTEPPSTEPPTTAPPPTIARPATTTTARPTTTTTLACRNSTDPKCGPFRYEPATDPNQPMAVTITAEADIHSGWPTTFHVEATDPDGSIDPVEDGGCGYTAGFGDGQDSRGCRTSASCPADNQFGPWDPPPKTPGTLVHDWSHTYAEPGQYTVQFELNINGFCGRQPYRSTGKATLTITVQP